MQVFSSMTTNRNTLLFFSTLRKKYVEIKIILHNLVQKSCIGLDKSREISIRCGKILQSVSKDDSKLDWLRA